MSFAHLHVHTQYSILDGQSSIDGLIEEAARHSQPALAITDHGNMFGVKEFLNKIEKHNKKNEPIIPILGSEVYVAHGSRKERKGREDQSSYHLILLAKNIRGYHNLIKLSSKAYIEGFYYKPRIDHELLEQYHDDLICCSACLGGEIPQAILDGDMEKAKEIALWYKSLFGDDYYLEVQRHQTDIPGANTDTFRHQQIVNEKIFRLGEELGIKVIATNDVHFVRKEDGPAHDRLICVSMVKKYDDPGRLRYTQQEYLKSTQEMMEIFSDHPEVISNTLDIVNKIETYSLDSDPILPVFPLPEGFTDSNDYLQYLTYEGAKKRYGENLTDQIKERIDFELATIKKMGFPDYFLIVRDFIAAARDMGVWVGPGRGSAAGSAVAYCLTITNIDPIKYNLLFERFLNPDRISMPDIDIDFDDEGRYKVFKYVEDKYGKDHVSHVITFGTMATKSAIKDIGRVEDLSLDMTDRISKMVPRKIPIEVEEEVEDEKNPGTKIKRKVVKEKDPTIKLCVKNIPEFNELANSDNTLIADTLKYAEQLEGNVRNTGVHACATIIGRDDLTNFIPLCTAKDKESGKDILVSQFEGSLIESVGMLKMDFLGLKTLTILKDCVEIIRQSKGIELDINNIPIDDKATYELFARGDTIGVFQFESDGMQSWLQKLRPSQFDDLIAMNALYRPGPMDYIPDFIDRKHGRKKIEYDLPAMEEYLKDTYGITVYQEQVMLLSQKLANFTKGKADKLRKAMGKKQISVMEELQKEFFEGGSANGHPVDILEKIWKDWRAFAEYAFNKSHATCYAWVGYQTGYLKANFRAEYMAAVLSNNLNNIDEITKLSDDCRRHDLKILGPDINESYTKFTVNKSGAIRYGMGGIKGIGSNAVESIIKVREEGGTFKDIYDFVERINPAIVNKKGIESLVFSGAFDSLPEINRAAFSVETAKDETFLDQIIRYASDFQKSEESMKNSLFGGSDMIATVKPAIPVVPETDNIELLKREKSLVGMYLSSHPLDKFRLEIDNIATMNLSTYKEKIAELANETNPNAQPEDIIISGMVSEVKTFPKANGNGIVANISIEDFQTDYSFKLFDKDYETFLGFLHPHKALLIKVGFRPRKRATEDKTGNKVLETIGYYPKVKAISLLDTARETLFKELTIDLPIGAIDQQFRKEFRKLISKHKGKSRLTFNVIDNDNKVAVEFVSGKYMITIHNEVLDYLKEKGVSYRIKTAAIS